MKQYNGQTLAYLGDAVYELLIRKHLLDTGHVKVDDLHKTAILYTSASGQYKALQKITAMLTETEISVIKRGRNGTISKKPKHVALQTYQQATGLEALFGYLYLMKDHRRIEQLLHAVTAND